MIRTAVSAVVDAPPSLVYGTFIDVLGWPEVFPAIAGVTVTRQDASTIEVRVDHREGVVPNVLSLAPPDTVLLRERKRRYDATFANRFTGLPDGRTHYRVDAEIALRGWRRLLASALGWFVRRQLRRLTVEPLRVAAESRAAKT